MKKYAVIVAGGSGARMGTAVPKQFLLLHGRPVLWYTLEVFLSAYADMEVMLMVPEEHLKAAMDVVRETQDPKRIGVAPGGRTRFHSVRNGLEQISDDARVGIGGAVWDAEAPGAAVIFVHDGVRCLLSKDLIHRCYEQAVLSGSAIPVVDSKDSVRLVTGQGSEAVDRSRVKLVQTPQTFLSHILLPAYRVDYREEFTDDATVVEAAGHTVQLIEGEADNIKITLPVDLVIAKNLLR